MKWNTDKLFKYKNKDAIKIKQNELAAAATDNLDLTGKKKVLNDFGKYYQEAVRLVKEEVGPEEIENIADEARRHNNGIIPPEVQDE
jgi:hypothetical protein